MDFFTGCNCVCHLRSNNTSASRNRTFTFSLLVSDVGIVSVVFLAVVASNCIGRVFRSMATIMDGGWKLNNLRRVEPRRHFAGARQSNFPRKKNQSHENAYCI